MACDLPQVNVNEGEKKGNVERWLLEVQETSGCISSCGSQSYGSSCPSGISQVEVRSTESSIIPHAAVIRLPNGGTSRCPESTAQESMIKTLTKAVYEVGWSEVQFLSGANPSKSTCSVAGSAPLLLPRGMSSQ